jgi:hypothetical protein
MVDGLKWWAGVGDCLLVGDDDVGQQKMSCDEEAKNAACWLSMPVCLFKEGVSVSGCVGLCVCVCVCVVFDCDWFIMPFLCFLLLRHNKSD